MFPLLTVRLTRENKAGRARRLTSVQGIDYGFVHWDHQASWRIPIILQCAFAIPAGLVAFFLPDTPRWYYARNRNAEGDATLSQLYDEPVDSEAVQETRRGIMANIEVELEANASLSWQQFLAMGFVDHTSLKIIRRLIICFWIPMVSCRDFDTLILREAR